MYSNLELKLKDKDGIISINNNDLLKYASFANIIACALSIRVYHFAFNQLSNQIIERNKLALHLGFPGEGLVDCAEFIFKGKTQNRLLTLPITNHKSAPFSLFGQFVFIFYYENKILEIYPKSEIFDDEFRYQVKTFQEAESSQERDKFLAYKEQKVKQIFNLEVEDLLEFRFLEA